VCTSGRIDRKPRFRIKDGMEITSTTVKEHLNTIVTVATSELTKKNGQYTCHVGGRERTFFIYIGTGLKL
jgi:hypothetical protein